MKTEKKLSLIVCWLGYTIFLAGTFIPLNECQKAQLAIECPASLLSYHVFTAAAFFVTAIGLCDIGYQWCVTRIIGIFYVLGSLAWLIRNICNTATLSAEGNTIINVTVGIITLCLLVFQHKNRNK